MEEVSKRLVEVEYILKLLNDEYLKKIPEEIWNCINENKDKSYIFKYDNSKSLEENNLNIDTVSMLTYINTEFLLEDEQKNEMIKLLKEDQLIAEENKRKKYDPNDIFKNRIKDNFIEKENLTEEVQIIEYKESFFTQIIKKIKLLFK